MARTKSGVGSTTGVRTSRKPCRAMVRANAASTRCQRAMSSGRTSFMPLTARREVIPRGSWSRGRAATLFPWHPLRVKRRVLVDRRVTKRTAKGRTMALDLGKARVGVAIDDELGSMAHPRGTIDGRNRRALLDEVRRMADDAGVRHIV